MFSYMENDVKLIWRNSYWYDQEIRDTQFMIFPKEICLCSNWEDMLLNEHNSTHGSKMGSLYNKYY